MPGSEAAEGVPCRVVVLGGGAENEGPPATQSGAARVLPYRFSDRLSLSILRCRELKANEL